jgi:exodeoxyribonuclease VII small subunit
MMTEPDDKTTTNESDMMQNMSYEKALAALEQVVSRLESGDITLDESMSLFQKGMALSKICSDKLASIEKQITQLIEKQDGSGQMDEKPFGEDL